MTTYEELIQARQDLLDQGLIEDSGERRPNDKGELEIVWRLSPLGLEVSQLLKEEK